MRGGGRPCASRQAMTRARKSMLGISILWGRTWLVLGEVCRERESMLAQKCLNSTYVVFGEPQRDFFAIVGVPICSNNRVFH